MAKVAEMAKNDMTGLTVGGETVKKVKTVRTKNYISDVKDFRMIVNFFRKV